jgi:nicotinamidase-related amidase
MARVWDDILTERDKQVIEKAGYGKKGAASWESRGLGRSPVVMVIDMQQLIVGRNVPILEAIDDYRTAMGDVAWGAIEHIAPFLEKAREANVPIIYTRVIPRGHGPDSPAVQIVEAVGPREGDLVIDKNYASAFYGTALLTHLVQRKADTIIIVGNSTSGCIRATAVDAKQHGYSVVLPEECIFDRIEASHKVGLLDLWMKYAEVVPTSEVTAYLERLA